MMRGRILLPDWPSRFEHDSVQKAQAVRIEKIERYRELLARHDWHHEFSDDSHVARKGRVEREQLRILQREVDPGFQIWNSIAPTDYRIGTRRVEVAS